jgi:hypothetical protein
MQRLEVSGAVRPIYGSLGVKRLSHSEKCLCLIECRIEDCALCREVLRNLE